MSGGREAKERGRPALVPWDTWPASRLGEALTALARESGLSADGATEVPPPSAVIARDENALSQWIEAAATSLGLEAEPLTALYGSLDALLHNVGPHANGIK